MHLHPIKKSDPATTRLRLSFDAPVPTWTGFVYLAIVLDVFSRRVVGGSMAHHLRTELVLGALNMALGLTRPSFCTTFWERVYMTA